MTVATEEKWSLYEAPHVQTRIEFPIGFDETPPKVVQKKPETIKRADGKHLLFAEILPYAKARANMLVVGPAGAGKSHLAEQLAAALGLRFGLISMAGDCSRSEIVGRVMQAGPNAGQYRPSVFVDFFEHGGLLLIDEMDSADANSLLALNAALANGHMSVDCAKRPLRKRHADFIAIAAANTWGNGADRQYVGRSQLDEATLDRFRAATFSMDYDAEIERKLGEKSIVEFAHRIRPLLLSAKFRRIVSTRWIIEASRLARTGIESAELIRRFLAGWTPEEKRVIGC